LPNIKVNAGYRNETSILMEMLQSYDP